MKGGASEQQAADSAAAVRWEGAASLERWGDDCSRKDEAPGRGRAECVPVQILPRVARRAQAGLRAAGTQPDGDFSGMKADSTNETASRPAWRHFGGKWRLAPFVIENLPEHDHYCEPFSGAASVLLRKARSPIETINDLDGEVVNFFRVLRNDAASLLNAIYWTPYARTEFVRAFEPAADPLERARRFYVRAQMTFGGVRSSSPQSAGWKVNITRESKRSKHAQEFSDVEHLENIAHRLIGVQIESRDALEVVQAYDAPGTCFYLDPPYHPATRDRRWRKAYAHELNAWRWNQMLWMLPKLKARVLFSCYPHAETNSYLQAHGFTCINKAARTSGGGQRLEALWLNAAAQQSTAEAQRRREEQA